MESILKKNGDIMGLTLMLIIPSMALLVSGALFIQVQSVTIFVACLLYLNIYKGTCKMHPNIFLISSLALFVWGTVVGFFYMMLDNSDLFKYIQYSFLAFSAYIGLKSGYFYARINVIKYCVLIAAIEIFLFLPLFVKNVGYYRSSIGASNLFPIVILFCLYPSFVKKTKVKILCVVLLIVELVCLGMSGMRSSMGVVAISTGLLLLYILLGNNSLLKGRLLKQVVIFFIVGSILLLVAPPSILMPISNQISTVDRRLRATLFNEEGVQVDTNEEEGRVGEGKAALRRVDEKTKGELLILGFGHGFTYFDTAKHQMTAHAHITYIAYYARYGVIGITLYSLMFLFVIINVLAYFFRDRTKNNMLAFSLWLCVLQIFLLSLIAASLISIINWIIIGMAVSFHFIRKEELN